MFIYDWGRLSKQGVAKTGKGVPAVVVAPGTGPKRGE